MFRQPINFCGQQVRCFSSKRMIGKHLLVHPHPRKVRRDRLARSAKVHRRRKRGQELKSKYVLEVEEAVKALQPTTGFLAPLNPSPRLNPLYAQTAKMTALNYRKVPISLTEPLDGIPQSWVQEFGSLDKVSITPLSVDIFSRPLRIDMVHRVVHWQRALKRQGTHKEKGRWEVRGGGRKPWQQKGTGRARHGSIRSPIWKGGGTVHPRTPHDYTYALPRKIRESGLKVVLSQKLRENNLVVIDSIPKDYRAGAAELEQMLRSKGIKSALIVDEQLVPAFTHAMMGVKGIHYMRADAINCYEVLNFKHTVITTAGLRALAQKYCLKEKIERYNEQVKENWAEQELIPDAIFDSPPRKPIVRQRHQTLEDTDWGRRKLKKLARLAV